MMWIYTRKQLSASLRNHLNFKQCESTAVGEDTKNGNLFSIFVHDEREMEKKKTYKIHWTDITALLSRIRLVLLFYAKRLSIKTLTYIYTMRNDRFSFNGLFVWLPFLSRFFPFSHYHLTAASILLLDVLFFLYNTTTTHCEKKVSFNSFSTYTRSLFIKMLFSLLVAKKFNFFSAALNRKLNIHLFSYIVSERACERKKLWIRDEKKLWIKSCYEFMSVYMSITKNVNKIH